MKEILGTIADVLVILYASLFAITIFYTKDVNG